MLKQHEFATFLIFTVAPLFGVLWARRRYCFDIRLPIYLFTLVPFAGAVMFVILIGHGFGIGTLLFAGLGYFTLAPFCGWPVLVGVLAWILACEIQRRARLRAIARFSIGASLVMNLGALALPIVWKVLGMLGAYEMLNWIVSGAFAGAIGGIIVVAFVEPLPHSFEESNSAQAARISS